MVYGLIEETRRDLIDLLMLEMNVEGEVGVGKLLLIDWNRLQDNASKEKVG